MTKRNEIASDHLRTQAADKPQDELVPGLSGQPESIHPEALLAQVLERANLQRALKQVRRNKGAPGIDGMSVDELPEYLKHHWMEIRTQLESGSYRPQPVLRVEIPKGDGKTRPLGIPMVVDRFIQQAIAQVVSAQWEPHFHRHSYGFRPQRSAHQAVREVQANIRAGYGWVVDMDLLAFFDRVNHDRLMARLKRRCPDAGLLRLVNRFLKVGVSVEGNIESTTLGVPQGGPLSPVLANVVLDIGNCASAGYRFAKRGTPASQPTAHGGCRRHRHWQLRYHCASSNLWDYPALRHGRNSIHRIAGYVTRSSGGVGGRGREASSYPD